LTKRRRFNPNRKSRLDGQIGRRPGVRCGLIARAVGHFKRPARHALREGRGSAGEYGRAPSNDRFRRKQVTHGGDHGSYVGPELPRWHSVVVP